MINYSIIIPHYDIPDLLGRCLRSIPERNDIQVIVVDDQSSNCHSLLDIVPELNRKNVEFYVVDNKKYAGHARNIGIDYAKGKWLMFADPDDFFVDNFDLIIDQHLNDEEDVIYFNYKSCDCYETTKILSCSGSTRFDSYYESGNELIFRLDFSEPWGKMIKHQFVLDHNIRFQEIRAHNDLFFGVQVGILAEKIKIVDKQLYWYVFREGSTGHNIGRESYDKLIDRLNAWHTVQNFLETNGYRTKTYLPVKTCIRVVRKDFPMFCRLIKYMRSENMRYFLAILQTIRISFQVLVGRSGPGFSSEVK